MLQIHPLQTIGEVLEAADVAALIATALADVGLRLQPFDVIVATQKILSKSEGRFRRLDGVVPSPEAVRLATVTHKDARLVEVALGETDMVMRAVPNILITRDRHGHVMANAGIDRSNIGDGREDRVLLLPENPDGSARILRDDLLAGRIMPFGVVISDSFGRAWRMGVTNVAIGASGLPSLVDHRGGADRDGRRLEVTQVALADLLASAAGLVMGEGAEGVPVALIRGMVWDAPEAGAAALIRPADQDLFR